jgi:O-antigen ligase
MGLILFYISKKKMLYLIGAVLAFFLVLGSLNEVQLDRYRSVYDSDTKNAATSEGRFAGWGKDIKVAMRRPLFGHGLGTSLEANANFRNNAQRSHNIFIEILQELGIVGLFMILMYVRAVIKSLTKNEAGKDNICKNTLMPVKSAFTVLALTTFFFGFASYGLSSYEWYLIGGCTVVLNKLLLFETNNKLLHDV